MNLPWRKLLALAGTIVFAGHSPGASPKVMHLPKQPKSGEPVRITVKLNPPLPGGVALQYQVVEPGKYIALTDSAFKNTWTSVAMNDEGRDGDQTSGDNIFSVELPGKLQVHRQLVRYRILANGRVLAPEESEAVPNFTYFVYDGVPSWRAAVNPKSNDPKLRTATTFGTNVMRSLPVYHLIARKASIENATWYEQPEFGDEAARRKYSYTGTFVADDGKVYDHVRFRARGGEWRYAMGKNMWKLDFNRGEHLQARDNLGTPYKAKWEKLNLGACIQQGSYGMRGEHGMFEAVGFALFNLVGVEAPRTHWVHFRIIDGPEENPANQYDGDFWGLYLATEDMDDAFLKEHELPSGNLYKMEFGRPDLHSKSKYATPNNEDVRRFMAACRPSQSESWWRTNVDLPRYFSYRSIVECIHHYDIGAGKNYFYYHNPANGRWSVLPWDVDLTWGDHMYGTGAEPFYRLGIPTRPPFNTEYRNRLREIRDLLYNPKEMDALIEDFAAIISNPEGGPSFVDAERAKWDYHPIFSSRFVVPQKSRPGQFYESSPTHDFRGMLQLMKNYVRKRSAWIDNALLGNAPTPPTPTVSRDNSESFSASTTGDESKLGFEWRLAEVTQPTGPRANRKYEIVALWQTNGTSRIQLPSKLLENGHSYRVRTRSLDASGQAGHWSPAIEFTAK